VQRAKEAKIFGEAVRELRRRHEWTQEVLAAVAGLTTTYVGQVERGEKVPSLTVILKLSVALSTAPSELLVSFTPAILRSLHF
jgi:transcriptional regulator with XRE-family HTH domain